MSDVANPVLQWLNTNPNWSGFITFAISAAESVAVVGTIIPGSVMMTAIGTLAGAGIIPLWPTLFWAILGAIIGDGISYWVGYHFRSDLHQVWPFRTHPKMLLSGEKFFKKYGGMSVFIGRFVGPVRALVPLVAGMFGVKPFRFTIANVLSAIGWAPAYMLPGILLGAASLELPPDLTTHAFVTLLLMALFIILCAWLIWKTFLLVHTQINQFLNWIWHSLKKSRYFHIVTLLLKHHNPAKTHGQLTLAFYLIIASGLFITLASYLTVTSSSDVPINKLFFHFSRSLHTPLADHIMIAFTLIGELFVHTSTLIILTGILFVWLASSKRWYTAWHVAALAVLAVVGVEGIKHLVHSPRPWGIFYSPPTYSFPSGHTALGTIFLFGFAILINITWQFKRRWPLFALVALLSLGIGMSRIYLGMHWFTDVIGAWLLSVALLMLTVLSYNRQKEAKPTNKKFLVVAMAIALLLTGSYTYYKYDPLIRKNSALIDWPAYSINLDTWWQHNDKRLPLYRLSRFGVQQEILNLQWVGSLETIRNLLLTNGWEVPPTRDWISVLQRLTDVNSAEHLPLVSPLYLDKKPVLVLQKSINNDKKLIVLRLWQSNLTINNSTDPLWVGTVSIIPRTYSWLFKKTRSRKVPLTEKLLFNDAPGAFMAKRIIVKPTPTSREYSIILIKPKTIH